MFSGLAGRLASLVRAILKGYREDDGNLLAAAMAYYATLSFFPLLLVLISAFGLVLQFSNAARDAQEELLRLLADNSSPGFARHVGNVVTQVRNHAAVGGPVGMFFLLLASIGIFAQFERAFSRIWKIVNPSRQGILAAVRNALFHRLRAFLMLSAVGALVVVAFVATMAASWFQPLTEGVPGLSLLWDGCRFGAGVAVNCVLFALLYRVLPRAAVRWREAFYGGLLAALLWEVARQVLAMVLALSRYNAYGLVGSMILIMLWFYVGSSLLLLGAECVRVLQIQRDQR